MNFDQFSAFVIHQPDHKRKLIGDERRFKQVLINLVKNALKFTRKGTIEIMSSYDAEQHMLQVQVRDSGSGIAPEDVGKLFSRFGKLERT